MGEHETPADGEPDRPARVRRRGIRAFIRRRRRRLKRRLRRSPTWTRLRYLSFDARVRKWSIWIVGGLLGLGLIWIVVTAIAVRQEVSRISARVAVVRGLLSQGRIDEARQVAADIPGESSRAHDLTTGPAWWVAAHIPYLGQPLQSVRQITAVQDRVGSTAIPDLLKVAQQLSPNSLRVSGSQIRLQPLIAARPELATAVASLQSAEASLDRGSGSWLGALNSRRDTYRSQLAQLTDYVQAADRAARIVPTMLGDGGKRRYFIGLQNEAEMRGTGGLPGAFAIATTQNGTLTFERFESDSVLLPDKTGQRIDTGLDFGSDYNALFAASEPTSSYQDSNVSPNFPYAAQIWAAMWQKVSGERVDGVLAVDPTALAYFLQAVGPATLPQGGTVNAANVVSLTQKDEYSIFADNNERKKFLVSVVKASAKQLTSGAGTPQAIVQAASRASSERRLLIWDRNPAIERVLAQTMYAGQIPVTSRAFAAPILNNSAAGKLDYYLQRSLVYGVSGCGSTRDVVATITLTNDAPASGLPAYVTTRLDSDPPPNVKPGDNRTLLDFYGTAGGLLVSARIDGQFAPVTVLSSLGHPVYRVDVELPRGKTRTISLHLKEPATYGAPEIWSQPGVNPLTVQEFTQKCG